MNHSMKPLTSFGVLSGFQMLSYLAIKIITGKGTKKKILKQGLDCSTSNAYVSVFAAGEFF